MVSALHWSSIRLDIRSVNDTDNTGLKDELKRRRRRLIRNVTTGFDNIMLSYTADKWI